ncbi:MAG: hypothetical protein BWK76_27855 [Desulfobulbaceae bacterium A2]|nr:MAG: hypothetical protein BWK76_27855 [Desulfobulbaceae bacterium A2]
MDHMNAVELGWEIRPDRAVELADFFVACVDASYISHGEMMEGRATYSGTWSDHFDERMRGEFAQVLENGSTCGVAVARLHGALVGLALVEWAVTGSLPYMVLSDMVVDRTSRRLGIGRQLLVFIEDQARQKGMHAMFLESGIRNSDAHRFFQREGFSVVSLTMMKKLD